MWFVLQIRTTTGARIVFPTSDDADKEIIHIIGKEESVEAAKQELLSKIKDLVRNFNISIFLSTLILLLA